jgi:hypothetical protein
MGYLETDSEDKVRLYERFGFEVVREQQVIGVRNWFAALRARRTFHRVAVPRQVWSDDADAYRVNPA